MCVKINVLYVQCTVYILHIYAHCAYIICPVSLFNYPRRTKAFARISKITTRKTRNVCKCCEQR